MKQHVDFIDPAKTGLLLIDFQENLMPLIERGPEIVHATSKLVKTAQLLEVPVLSTEQVRLGSTLAQIQSWGIEPAYTKSSFSCMRDGTLQKVLMESSVEEWILCGIEAHICVLQTAKDLLKAGKRVSIPNDTISSRSIFDFSTAIAELRDVGARITSSEIILFEWIQDAGHARFKEFLSVVKEEQPASEKLCSI